MSNPNNFDSFQEGIINGGYNPRVEDNHPVQGGDDWYDAPVDLYGAPFEGHGTYEDYEPNPYDGTYSEM